MEILEAISEKGNAEEEIEQWTENHRPAVAIYYAQIEEIENRIVTMKREKEVDDAERKEKRIQRKLEEERRILVGDEEKRREGEKKKRGKKIVY